MAQSSLMKARASYSVSSPPVDVEGAETSNASGARVWTITLFTIIACLGSMSNGFIMGYSSATIAELNNTETGEHGLSSDSESSSWFAVSISPRSSFYLSYEHVFIWARPSLQLERCWEAQLQVGRPTVLVARLEWCLAGSRIAWDGCSSRAPTPFRVRTASLHCFCWDAFWQDLQQVGYPLVFRWVWYYVVPLCVIFW